MQRPLNYKQVVLDAELNQRLDEFRFEERFKSEAAAIRELMRLGLAALQEKGEFAA